MIAFSVKYTLRFKYRIRVKLIGGVIHYFEVKPTNRIEQLVSVNNGPGILRTIQLETTNESQVVQSELTCQFNKQLDNTFCNRYKVLLNPS